MKQITKSLTSFTLCAVLLGSLTPATFAQASAKKPTAKTAAKPKANPAMAEVKYKAQCGMVYSAAEAKKNHYICPMDHKPLVKMAANTGQHKK